MNSSNPPIPFGIAFASEPVAVQRPDPVYSAEAQISEGEIDAGTDTYLTWTEDSDA